MPAMNAPRTLALKLGTKFQVLVQKYMFLAQRYPFLVEPLTDLS